MLSDSDFHPFTFENMHVAEKYFAAYPKDHSEYSLVTILSWEHYSPCGFAEYRGCLVIECRFEGERSIYAPAGPADDEIFCEVVSYAKSAGAFFNLYSEEDAARFKRLYPDIPLLENRDYFEYCWHTETLKTLAGRKFLGIRGQINRFKRLYPYSVEDIVPENLEDVRSMIHQWYAEKTPAAGSAVSDELLAADISLDHFAELHLEGILLRIEGVPAAVSIWENRPSDVALIHYEKGLRRYSGIYKVINQETAVRLSGRYAVINREGDMDDAGLREAKMRYHPEFFIGAYTAEQE